MCPNSQDFYNSTGLKNDNPLLFMWDKQNGVCKLGQLPGKEISAINNAGQVLIKSIVENQNGRSIRRPVIWENGKITKLQGLEGDLGIESDESYGFDMNNKGEVVGYSVAYLSYKNNIYKQKHAVKWINGCPIDLHRIVPKSSFTEATTINDLGDVVVSGFLVCTNGEVLSHYLYSQSKATNTNYFLNERCNTFIDKFKNATSPYSEKIHQDYDCIWMALSRVIGMNDKGEVIAQGKTIYEEEHIILLVPVNN